MHNRPWPLGAALLAIAVTTPAVAPAIEVKISRSIAGVETLTTAPSEQMEVSFKDGAAIVLGSDSRADIRSADDVLTGLDLASGTFEINTAPDGIISLKVAQCEADIINGTLRVIAQQGRVDFVLQSGNTALVRRAGQVALINKPGFGLTDTCDGADPFGAAAKADGDVLARLDQSLGQRTPATKRNTQDPATTSGPTNVSYLSPNPFSTLKPGITAPKSKTLTAFRLPVSVSPSFPTDDVGGSVEPLDPPFNSSGGGLFTGPRTGPGPGPTVPPGPTTGKKAVPTDIATLVPRAAARPAYLSTVYDNRTASFSEDIRFAIDPAAPSARILDPNTRENISLSPSVTINGTQASDIAVTRLPVNGTTNSFVTFTYFNVGYALISGTHSIAGDLVTSPLDGSFQLAGYETFRLSTGTTQPVTGIINGLAIDRTSGSYVTLASQNFGIGPSGGPAGGTATTPFNIGVGGTLDLAVNGTAFASLDLFGSAVDDTSHYFDLSAQNGGGASVSLGSGETIPGLNVPAGTPKYGSYLDWGILRGTITSAGQTIDAMPTPWVAGREWSARDLDGFSGTAVYKGHVLGNAVDTSGARTAFGTYDNAWDFGSGTGTVSIDFDGTTYAGQTSRVGGTVGFTGTLAATGRSGSVTGKFYGNSQAGVAPDAVGGAFSVRGSGTDQYGADGVFAGKKQ